MPGRDHKWMAERHFAQTLTSEQRLLLNVLIDGEQDLKALFSRVMEEAHINPDEAKLPAGQLLLDAEIAYGLGRRTAALHTVVENACDSWNDLLPQIQERILDRIEAAFDKNDVGDPVDAQAWNRLLVTGGRQARESETLRAPGF